MVDHNGREIEKCEHVGGGVYVAGPIGSDRVWARGKIVEGEARPVEGALGLTTVRARWFEADVYYGSEERAREPGACFVATPGAFRATP